MRIVLIGTVESTAVTLQAMIEAGHPPVGLVSLEPSLAHRHSDYVDMFPAASAADAAFIPVRVVNAPEVVSQVAALEPDWLVVVGWSQILDAPLLATARVGTVGYHPSPLPALRGRAVLAWTILLGRTWTAGSLFTLEPEVDSGRILAQRRFDLDVRETLPTLMSKHLSVLAQMWRTLLPRMATGHVEGIAQDESMVSYCGKRTTADGRIDWASSAADVDRLVRAVTAPYPGAFTHRSSDRLVIWEAEPWEGPIHYGPVGQILSVTPAEMLVACRLGETLLVRKWEWTSHGEVTPLRVGHKLGG